MLEGYSPLTQALLGTLFTWGLTAAGAALVFVFSSRQKRILDGSLGFAAGVMLAASYWSLLAPAIDMAEESGKYGSYAFVPVAIGFTLGATFVYIADLAMPLLGVGSDPHTAFALPPDSKLAKEKAEDPASQLPDSDEMTIRIGRAGPLSDKIENGDVYQRRRGPHSGHTDGYEAESKQQEDVVQTGSSWRRILLLILAITIHNIPEGLAVGVGFGAIGKTTSATFESARNLAIGIGIQNFPEGLAVSLPLRGSGVSTWRAFWYGQLSGMVEPIAGLLGAGAVVLAEPLLPFALAFAAGAMVYVVVDDIIPEAQVSGNGRLASWTSILGFVVMMSLDVGLG
ncbi:zinc transporter ZIP11 isoform X1 [Kryptolebias marmoratus]|uniref:zinc transporter ZIP11 isoform X1 n=1 Tax=Kryptolebias marmoratus TaxID=37003 RepID=UPI0007F8FCDD|nr:zinc transporter ZIP11 isoform X1 [Kryptolebias marmoratus]XP_037836769.1 zinc transporter ZIP11 isoform X1 [Kryptolebias marmoratus]XP_037836770.1 zinc transporter ZIP11 isoform X1 [Kryptolebias marmoratus]XP_037836772.1 zinc transporter ZIP11 isoform X1 [Kryptolebias marmoratus]